MSETWSNCPIKLFLLFQDRGRLDGTRIVTMLLAAPSSSTIIPPSAVAAAAAPSASSSTSRPIASAASSESARRQSLPHPLHRTGLPVRTAHECIHNLCLARRLGAWCNLPATTGDCRGYVRGVLRGRLGEERCFWWIQSRRTCRGCHPTGKK